MCAPRLARERFDHTYEIDQAVQRVRVGVKPIEKKEKKNKEKSKS